MRNIKIMRSLTNFPDQQIQVSVDNLIVQSNTILKLYSLSTTKDCKHICLNLKLPAFYL